MLYSSIDFSQDNVDGSWVCEMIKVKYIGPNIGIDGLKNNGIYEVIALDELTGMLHIIDESGEDYLYSPTKPKAIAGSYKGGKFEIVSDPNKILSDIIK